MALNCSGIVPPDSEKSDSAEIAAYVFSGPLGEILLKIGAYLCVALICLFCTCLCTLKTEICGDDCGKQLKDCSKEGAECGKTALESFAPPSEKENAFCFRGWTCLIGCVCGAIAMFCYAAVQRKVVTAQAFMDYNVTVCWIDSHQICDPCDNPYRPETILRYIDPKNDSNIITKLTCIDISCPVYKTKEEAYNDIAPYLRSVGTESIMGKVHETNPTDSYLTIEYTYGWYIAGLFFFVAMGFCFICCLIGLHLAWCISGCEDTRQTTVHPNTIEMRNLRRW